MKTQLLLLMTVLLTGNLFGQGFQRTIYNPKKDFNHYSIENVEKGYVCVGTLFGRENNDIHIIYLDNNGQVIWERIIDETKDDRALDVVVDPKGNIVLTGYTSPSGGGNTDLYVAKLDPNGNYISDRSLFYSNKPNDPDNELMTVGTNIIYSEKTETYIVGGLTTGRLVGALTNNTALLLEFDLSLSLLKKNRIFTGHQVQSINDITAVSDGYFVTGGIDRPGSRQGVLAAIVDYDLDILRNFSFDDKHDAPHSGASVVYDKKKDDMYVLSNNAKHHNPQITRLSNISDNIPWCEDDLPEYSYLLVLDKSYKDNAAGYKLEECLWDDNHLIASGYFEKRDNGNGNEGAIAWIIEFEKATGNRIAGMEWTIPPATGFMDQGGLLSQFTPYTPLYYTQEMMTRRNDNKGYVILTPRIINNKYSLELMTTYFMEPSGCFKEFDFRPYPIDIRYECIDQSDIDIWETAPKSYPSKNESKQDQFCQASSRSQGSTQLGIVEEEVSNILTVYPNPAHDNVVIQLPVGIENGKIEMIDLSGKVVLQRNVNNTNIGFDITGLDNGIYYVRLITLEKEVFQNKFVKAN